MLTLDGDTATCLIILTAGSATVRLSTANGDGAMLGILKPGDVIGEVGLVSHRTERTADVTALETVDGLVLTRDAFTGLRARNPQVNDFVMQLMASRIDRLSHRLIEAYRVPVPHRVARRLYELSKPCPGSTATLRLTQSDLGDLTGATRPSVNAVLRNLERLGAVRLGRASITVLDRAQLREHCA